MTRLITPERLLEENEALRQIIREALDELVSIGAVSIPVHGPIPPLLERMRAAIGEKA